jgi:hypothetical protein
MPRVPRFHRGLRAIRRPWGGTTVTNNHPTEPVPYGGHGYPPPAPPRWFGLSKKQLIGIVIGGVLLLCCGLTAIGAALNNPRESADGGSARPAATTPRAAAGVDVAPTTAAPTTTAPAPRSTTVKPTPAKTTPRTTAPRPSTTTPKPKCHPSYEGKCVPFASDVDCAGGSGNGPVYIEGPVRVVGPDVYDLDRDNDGWGCED